MDNEEQSGKDIIKELENLSAEVLKLKKDVIPRRPILIEFCGSPKSGKTSCINSLDLFLRRNDFRTKLLTERAGICPIKNKRDPYFNIWAVSSIITALSEILSNHPKDYDVVIMDRGLFDSICWFSWLLEKQHLDDENFNSLKEFILMSRWRSVLDIIYVFTADPNISMDREFANLLTEKTGSIMRPEILSSYNNTICNCIPQYEGKFKKIEKINTSNTPLNEVNYQVTKKILEILRESTSEKIAYFLRTEINQDLPNIFAYSKISCKISNLKFDIRNNVEESSEFIQPIPILIITNKEKSEIFVVRKSQKSTPSSSPEHNKTLLYLGGHIRQEDKIESGQSDLLAIAKYALHREIKEEISFDFFPQDTEPFCIWVRNNERSEKHMAICYQLEVDFNTSKFKLDKNEFVATTASNKSGKPESTNNLTKSYDSLEEWSQEILQHFFGYSHAQRNVSQGDIFETTKSVIAQSGSS